MSSKILKEVQSFNKTSQANSWRTYLRMLRVVERTNTAPRLAEIIGYFEAGDIASGYAVAEQLESQKYTTPAEHFAAAQVCNLIKKYPFPERLNPFDPEGVARAKFEESEISCSHFNQALTLPQGDFEDVLHKMRSFIRYVLGDAPNLAQVYEGCMFGPGASIDVNGNATNLARKFLAASWSVSSSAFEYARSALMQLPLAWEILIPKRGGRYYTHSPEVFGEYFRKRARVVNYNKIAFVPKTAKTHRSIAVEPLLNTFLQKGVDTWMRNRLKRVGIDLSDQSINSRYALYGSTGESADPFCTIDLSSASDSISIELVRNLLPYEWFRFLDSIRSRSYQDASGEIRCYHKFCSMGNGFCFPLETLIFAACCTASGAGVPKTDFLVYGDDIVVRRSSAEAVLRNLSRIGFTPNPKKTFIEGPFRESCGRDWFAGEDVRPFVLDFALDSLQSHFKFLNLTLRNSRTSWFFEQARDFIKKLLPVNLRFSRPSSGSVDGGYQVELDEFMSSKHAVFSRKQHIWTWRELVFRPMPDKGIRGKEGYDTVVMIAALLGSASSNPFTVRRKTRTRVAVVCNS